jgi:hypothetical protein
MIVLQESLDALARIVDRTTTHMPDAERDALLARAVRDLPALEESPDLHLPVRRLSRLGSEIETQWGVPARVAFAAALVAHLALRLSDRLSSIGLPDSVVDQYPGAFERLVAWLSTADLAAYWSGDELFLKDVRIAGGYSVPCGAQDVDLYSTISRRSGLKSIVTQRDLRNGLAVIRWGGPPWFSIHTDPRHLDDFNEQGWEQCYRRIADLLMEWPKVKGVVGTSWFYDPQLAEISPRLAYLQTTPLANGALVVRHGPGEIHSQRATATSPTRRALLEQGSYLPICCSMLWPRAELLRWASRGLR